MLNTIMENRVDVQENNDILRNKNGESILEYQRKRKQWLKAAKENLRSEISESWIDLPLNIKKRGAGLPRKYN